MSIHEIQNIINLTILPVDSILWYWNLYQKIFEEFEVAKARYWKLTPDEVEKFTYNQEKLLNWDIKCVREPEEEAKFIGVFMYRDGTPFDYESIKGITYYHNHIDRDELPKITKFLKDKFGGKEMEKGDRIFLKDSEQIFSGKDIAALAKEMESNFKTKTTITLEFHGLTEEDQKNAGLPEAKLLPIPGE